MPGENIDLGYDGRRGVLGAWLAHGVLIDCGPASCLQALLAGLQGRRPRALLLTHIHLDHAGAAGALTARWPDLPVYVHPLGAPHLVDPSRLLASARRVFGGRLEALLGELTPVPAANIRALVDGQAAEGFTSAWTPGHASHHVAFLDPRDAVAYTGDVAGVRLAGGVVLPPTPPPDIDLRRWEGSLELLERWRPRALALAHFGCVLSPREHIAQLRQALARHERWAAAGVEEFEAALHEYLGARVASAEVEDYEFIAMAAQSPLGLRRWLERERAAGAGAGER